MVSLRLVSAVAAATTLSMVSAQSKTSSAPQYSVAPTILPANAMTDIGCFNISDPLVLDGEYNQQSHGNCHNICVYLNKDVMATSDGTKCYCGDLLPPAANQISNSTCDTKCGGYGDEYCGGYAVLWVQLTGQSKNPTIPNYVPSATPSSTSMATATSTSTSMAQSSQKASTVVTETATATPSSSAPSSDNSSPNKIGIAVGVVVGGLGLVAILGGVFFFLRHKRRREVEEEFRRQANMNSFTAGGKLHTSNSSMTDSRLDPEFMARRASNGSIADNEDYSRRILKVTNA